MQKIFDIKYICLFFSLLIMAIPVHAQGEHSRQKGSQTDCNHQPIFNREGVSLAGFGGPLMNLSAVNGELGYFLGAGGGVSMNNFFLGGYGMGLINNIPKKGHTHDNHLHLDYGGLWFGYTYLNKTVIHPSFHVKTGWGVLRTANRDHEKHTPDDLFVLSPALGVELSLIRFFRLALGVNYSWFYGIELDEYENTDLDALGAHITFMFGNFDT